MSGEQILTQGTAVAPDLSREPTPTWVAGPGDSLCRPGRLRRPWSPRSVASGALVAPAASECPELYLRAWKGGGGHLPPWPRENCVAFIICEPCIGTKDSACVDVCPVDCIHPRKDETGFGSAEMLYIHPDECIDCGACVPACPVEAIFSLDETPEKWESFIPVNAQYYQP